MVERVIRRLTAILVADMVGSARLIGLDEEGTIARQQTLRRELIEARIAAFGGPTVKTTGDGLLVEFLGRRSQRSRSIPGITTR